MHRNTVIIWIVAVIAVAVFAVVRFAGSSTAPPPDVAPPTDAPADAALPVPSHKQLRLVHQRIGAAVQADDRPLITNVNAVDLDQDGRLDVLACDAHANGVAWLRQTESGDFEERMIGPTIGAPAHTHVIDFDADGDLDVVVAALGIVFPNNSKIGSVIVLENDGKQSFTARTVLEQTSRVADARAADLDGDGDLDIVAAQFGYDDGETRWLENKGDWQFESHVIQRLSGVINAIPFDIDSDGDLDILSLVSQEWEEVYLFVNDGKGGFTPKLVWGSTNEDFGSSWIAVHDLDGDGDLDAVYSNGDSLDYEPAIGRKWHGVQWLENTGDLAFKLTRLADLSGAMSPVAADFDSDGDADIVVVSGFNDWSDPSAASMVWLENTGGATFVSHVVSTDCTHLVSADVGDFNGDGRLDLVTGALHVGAGRGEPSRVLLWINEGVDEEGAQP